MTVTATGTTAPPASVGELRMLPISALHDAPLSLNPRTRTIDRGLDELAASIRRQGILTPLIVRPVWDAPSGQERFEVGAGHRRRRAAALAGLEVVPCVVRELEDDEFADLVLVENLQRSDPHPLDEAASYQGLVDRFGYDVAAIAARFGKGEAYVRGRLVLNNLIPDAIVAWENGLIELGHAQLLARGDAALQADLLANTLRITDGRYTGGFVPNADKPLEPEDEEEARQAYPLGDEDEYRHVDPPRPRMSVQALRSAMAPRLRPLAVSPWALDDASLVPAAGACTTCPKRSSAQATLFEEFVASDHCPDGLCWAKKAEACAARAWRAASAEQPAEQLVALTVRHTGSRKEIVVDGKRVPLLSPKKWTRAKTGRVKGVTQAVVLEITDDRTDYSDYELGEVLSVVLPEKKAATKASAAPSRSTPQDWPRQDWDWVRKVNADAEGRTLYAVAAVVRATLSAGVSDYRPGGMRDAIIGLMKARWDERMDEDQWREVLYQASFPEGHPLEEHRYAVLPPGATALLEEPSAQYLALTLFAVTSLWDSRADRDPETGVLPLSDEFRAWASDGGLADFDGVVAQALTHLGPPLPSVRPSADASEARSAKKKARRSGKDAAAGEDGED